MISRSSAIVAAVIFVGSSVAYADSAAPASAPVSPLPASQNALDSIAADLATKLGAAAAGAHVVAPVVASDVAGTREADLGARLAERLSAHLNKDTKTAAAPPTSADRSVARVVLQAKITKGLLGVTADLYAAQGNGWDRVRASSPASVAHLYTSARMDAEIRSFLPPITLEQATLHRAKLGIAADDDVVALGCGAIEPGGPIELVVVTRARVKVGHLVHGAFAASDDLAWSDLAPRSATSLREPIGGVTFVPRFAVGTSDRGGVFLTRADDDSLRADGIFPDIPVEGSNGRCAHISPENDAFSGAIDGCVTGTSAPIASPTAVFDTVSISSNAQKDGSTTSLIAARSPDGAIHLTYAGAMQTWQAAGAQMASADLDLDGVPEVATTRGSDPDALLVTTFGQGKPRLYFPAPAGVRALAACPAEERGVPALAAIVGDEVWLVR